jgi:hypothetical protein
MAVPDMGCVSGGNLDGRTWVQSKWLSDFEGVSVMSSEELRTSTGRRQWLELVGGSAAALLALGLGTLAAGQNPSHPTGSEPAGPGSKDDEDPKVTPPTKLILQANDKDIKKSIERLFQLASELKAEVEKTDSAQVLSLAMVRKAEEIEKLARDIKSRAKG